MHLIACSSDIDNDCIIKDLIDLIDVPISVPAIYVPPICDPAIRELYVQWNEDVFCVPLCGGDLIAMSAKQARLFLSNVSILGSLTSGWKEFLEFAKAELHRHQRR